MFQGNSTSVKSLTYKCPTCHEKFTVLLNIESHKRNQSLLRSGLAHYYDIHFSELHGMHAVKLSIDASHKIRGTYPVEQLIHVDNSYLLQPAKSYSYFASHKLPENRKWVHWDWLNIVSSTHQLIVSVGKSIDDIYFESSQVPRQENDSFIWDRVISTAASVTIDWHCPKRHSDVLYQWFFRYSQVLQSAATISLNEITEALIYIDLNADRMPAESDIELLMMIMDTDTGIIEINDLKPLSSTIKPESKINTSPMFPKLYDLLKSYEGKEFTLLEFWKHSKALSLRETAEIMLNLKRMNVLSVRPSYIQQLENTSTLDLSEYLKGASES